MSFKIMAYVMTVGCCVLGTRFMLAGASLLEEWGIEATDGPLVICRRLGAIYFGLALLFFLGRTAPPSDLRSGVCLGIGGASAMLAGLGLFERRAGRVGSGIVVSVVAEILLAAAFLWTWRSAA
ncbi:MAG: hypothetical protein KC731_33215 [Myxococcales bacterium]|nr:hypothetical protein [Myxococcales bacterium]